MNCQAYLVADLFSGSGGSPTGAVRVVAGSVSPTELVAVKRWPVAVETHQQNGQASVKETGAARTAVAFVITTEAPGYSLDTPAGTTRAGPVQRTIYPPRTNLNVTVLDFVQWRPPKVAALFHRLNKLVTVSARPTHGLLIGE